MPDGWSFVPSSFVGQQISTRPPHHSTIWRVNGQHLPSSSLDLVSLTITKSQVRQCHPTAILRVVTSHIRNPFHYTTSTKMAPKRPPPMHKATPSAVQTRQKAKKVVSTSTLFAQIPKLKAAHTSTRVTALKQPQARRMVAVVIPKKGADHPLLNEFNGLSLNFSLNLSSLSLWMN